LTDAVISTADLRAAVAAGTLTEAQAADLAALAHRRAAGRAAIRPGEEPFELFRGFNEVFIVAGLAILGLGWVGLWSVTLVGAGDFGTIHTAASLATLALVAALAEYFVRRRRMVAPAIALSLAWGATALAAWLVWTDALSVFGGVALEAAALGTGLAALTVLAFWWRYRVPFAMALIAVAAFATLMLALASTSGREVTLDSLFLLSASGPFAWGTLAFGLAVFALAMRFDMGDPHRVSLRSANGFWLHVAAAPAIVNTVALTLLDAGGAGALATLALILLALGLVAIVIDRRSFLLAAIGYSVALSAVVLDGDGAPVLVLALGAALVTLGAAWARIRSVLVRPLPASLKDRLPPAA
jgi:hypothetical protein